MSKISEIRFGFESTSNRNLTQPTDLVRNVRPLFRRYNADADVFPFVTRSFEFEDRQLPGVEMPHRLAFELAPFSRSSIAL